MKLFSRADLPATARRAGFIPLLLAWTLLGSAACKHAPPEDMPLTRSEAGSEPDARPSGRHRPPSRTSASSGNGIGSNPLSSQEPDANALNHGDAGSATASPSPSAETPPKPDSQ